LLNLIYYFEFNKLISYLVIHTILAGSAPYFVYKRYKKTISNIISLPKNDKFSELEALSAIGGVNKWGVRIPIILIIILLIHIFSPLIAFILKLY